MASLVRVADSFINVRASFKIGPADIHTHASLVKRKNGKWLMLDSVKMEDAVKAEVDSLTDGGKALEAVLNVHPFHTASCEAIHQSYPDAKLYGTQRHKDKLPSLPWQSGLIEDAATQNQFSEDLSFSVPKGVDFISSNESVHFSSVLAYHMASKTLHVDDTFMFIATPKAAEIFGFKEGTVQLHPTLAGALQQRKGAVEDFKAWLHEVSSQWETENLCTAHLGNLLAKDNTGQSIRKRMEAALTLAQPVLLGHELFWGKHEKAKP